MIIGHFQKLDDRIVGKIHTMLFSTDAIMYPVERVDPRDPDYLIKTSSDTEIGAAWQVSVCKPGQEIELIVEFDDPVLEKPIFCNLVQSGANNYILTWHRHVESPWSAKRASLTPAN